MGSETDAVEAQEQAEVQAILRRQRDRDLADATGRTNLSPDLQQMAWESVMEDVDKRLAQLAALEDGWNDGIGASLGRPALDLARVVTQGIMREHGTLPYLYPTLDGDVQLEWDVDGIAYEVQCSGWEI